MREVEHKLSRGTRRIKNRELKGGGLLGQKPTLSLGNSAFFFQKWASSPEYHSLRPLSLLRLLSEFQWISWDLLPSYWEPSMKILDPSHEPGTRQKCPQKCYHCHTLCLVSFLGLGAWLQPLTSPRQRGISTNPQARQLPTQPWCIFLSLQTPP